MALSAITDFWVVNNTPAAAAQATAAKAAGAAGVRHVGKRAMASTSTIAATAQTPRQLNLRDGATGAGTVLIVWTVAVLGTTFAIIDADNLHLIGTAATAMTLEFDAAGVANSQQVVTLIGYDN